MHDYGNKDWAGLTRDYYMKRWKVYFSALDDELRTNVPAKPIDWFALGEEWNRGKQRYTTRPQGDAYALATETAKTLGLID